MSLGGDNPEVAPRPSRIVALDESVHGTVHGKTLEAKPGSDTTEFKLTIAGIAAGVILILAGHAEIGGAILATVIPGYALSRGRAKGR